MKKIIMILVVAFAALACNDEIKYNIPYAPVNLKLDLNYLDADLIPQGNYKVFTTGRASAERVGYGGILVIHGFGSIDNKINLYAYDLACPNEVDREIRVVPNSSGQAVCPECGAVFSISTGDGHPLSDAEYSLRPYKVLSLAGERQYKVSN